MDREPDPDPSFEIGFYESVLRRDPRYVEVIEILGGLYTKTGRIVDGLRMDRRLVRLRPDHPTAHYNLGCSLALCRRPTEALRSLRRAVELGYRDREWMAQDPDLEILKDRPEFLALLAALAPPGR
jgi:tetratricopeptide (TPR) repeat protein